MMITEEQRKQLSEWFRVDDTGLSHKDSAKLDALSATAVCFAKAVMENVGHSDYTVKVLLDISSAYRTAAFAVVRKANDVRRG